MDDKLDINKNFFQFSLFTKMWKTKSTGELALFVKELGFDGIEFPLRPGYQIEPADAELGLKKLTDQFEDYGLKIFSVASSTAKVTSENIFAGCQNAGIPMIRIMAEVQAHLGYFRSEDKLRRDIEALLPMCIKYGVKIGVQMHYGWWVSTSMQLHHLLSEYDPRYVGAIWDSAHSALAGEQPANGLDMVWDQICMVNLKNAFYKQTNGPEDERASWTEYFTTAEKGLADWNRTAQYLKDKSYNGVICLTAEYTNESQTEQYIAQDISYAKKIFLS